MDPKTSFHNYNRVLLLFSRFTRNFLKRKCFDTFSASLLSISFCFNFWQETVIDMESSFLYLPNINVSQKCLLYAAAVVLSGHSVLKSLTKSHSRLIWKIFDINLPWNFFRRKFFREKLPKILWKIFFDKFHIFCGKLSVETGKSFPSFHKIFYK